MEYLIGRGVNRIMGLRHRARLRKWKAGRSVVDVRDLERRFTLLASLVTGRETPVTAVHGDPQPRPYAPLLYRSGHHSLLGEHAFAWSDGSAIFLPISSMHMEDPAMEEDLLMMIVFFLSFQISAGSLDVAFRRRGVLGADQELSDLFWIIENRRLASLMKREYPGALTRFREVSAALVEARPALGLLRPSEARVEEFLRASLLDETPLLAVGSARESLALAKAVRGQWRSMTGPRRLSGVLGGVQRYRAIMPFVLYGRLIPGRLAKGPLAGKAADDNRGDDAPGGGAHEREREGAEKKRRVQKREEVDEEANDQGLALNIYDKFITWAEFVNVPRHFDDDPEDGLDKKADEMDEISTSRVERSTNAFFNAELEKGGGLDEEAGETEAGDDGLFTYPEWDYRKKSFREGYATLRVEDVDEADRDFALGVLKERRGLIKKLRHEFEVLNPELRPLKGQVDGGEIDLDAAVRAAGDRIAGRGADDRLYIREARVARDMSALFLVDLSMSTETYVGEKRVIDHEKEALLLLSESMKELRDRYAVYGFSGRNRSGCRYYRVKGFDEPCTASVRDRIGGLAPVGYTRMGPAVRHSTMLLEGESARVRLLFIISDGKPNDMDIYEGRYGIEDTAMAVREARKAGITPFCLTVDHSAGDYLPRLFGRGHFVVLQDARKLAASLPVLFARVVNGM